MLLLCYFSVIMLFYVIIYVIFMLSQEIKKIGKINKIYVFSCILFIFIYFI